MHFPSFALLLALLVAPAALGPAAAFDLDAAVGRPLAPAPVAERPLGATNITNLTNTTGTNVTVVLDNNVVLLSPGVHADEVIIFETKTLYVRTCYPCQEQRLLIVTRPDTGGCPIGADPRAEQRVCIEQRNGAQTGIALAETDDLGDALFAWGDGCIIHPRDGLPPQKLAVEGIAIPAVNLQLGGTCDA